jgi:phosphoribosylformimino-5-aminoimidazole carboxamide ribotide isomerase
VDVIPAIDMKGGHCVRLYQGEYDRETKYSDDPLAVAGKFARTTCTRLHVVDLDGARSGQQENRDSVRRIVAETDFKVQLGGGLRNESDVEEWITVGVSRLVIGSLAVTAKSRVQGWLTSYGAERIVLALDVRFDDAGIPRLATHGWTQNVAESLWECLDSYSASGLSHVLCTDISRDGALSGPNIGLYEEIMKRYPDIELQASGGVRSIDDLVALRAAGLPAAITGRALLDQRITTEEVRSFLREE